MTSLLKILIVATVLWLAALSSPGQYLYPPTPAPGGCTLAWDPSVSPNVVNYFIYYGSSGSRQYTNKVATGNVCIFSITNLVRGTTGTKYFFAATAQNDTGEESLFSDEVTYTTPALVQPPGNLHTTNALVHVALQVAPTPAGPWEPFIDLGTTTGTVGFYRSAVDITAPSPAPALKALAVPKKTKVLRAPKDRP